MAASSIAKAPRTIPTDDQQTLTILRNAAASYSAGVKLWPAKSIERRILQSYSAGLVAACENAKKSFWVRA
jgi:hypothetical protein